MASSSNQIKTESKSKCTNAPHRGHECTQHIVSWCQMQYAYAKTRLPRRKFLVKHNDIEPEVEVIQMS